MSEKLVNEEGSEKEVQRIARRGPGKGYLLRKKDHRPNLEALSPKRAHRPNLEVSLPPFCMIFCTDHENDNESP